MDVRGWRIATLAMFLLLAGIGLWSVIQHALGNGPSLDQRAALRALHRAMGPGSTDFEDQLSSAERRHLSTVWIALSSGDWGYEWARCRSRDPNVVEARSDGCRP